MESIRQKQIGELIKRHFSLLLQQEGRYIYGSEALVTVTNVRMSPDLGLAKVYLSVFNHQSKQEVILEMEDQNTHLRQALGSRIRRQIRRIPELHFYLDDTLDEMYRLNALFDRLEEQKQMGRSGEEEE